MNNGRLSTSNTTKLDRNQLMIQVDKLLTHTSNYEIRKGITFIISLYRYRVANIGIGVFLTDKDNEVFKSFSQVAECVKYLGLARSTVKGRVENGQQFIFKGESSLPFKSEKHMFCSFKEESKIITIKIVES